MVYITGRCWHCGRYVGAQIRSLALHDDPCIADVCVCVVEIPSHCSFLTAGLLFFINRTAILRRRNSVKLAFWSMPALVWVTIFVNVFLVLYKVGQVKSLL
jgi:hypothetical protein